MHSNTVPSHADFPQVLRKAGFPPFTPLQEKLAPLVLRGKDVVVESEQGAEAAASFLLPLILGLRGAGPAPHALLLVPTVQDVGNITQIIGRFLRALRDVPLFVPLGEIDDARREQRRIEKGATIVAGTTERVIDHLRRGSLNVAELAAVVVKEPVGDARADFIRDVQFIFAKLAGRHQTVLLSSASPASESELVALLHHPVVLSAGPSAAAEKEHLFFVSEGRDKAEDLARILLGRRIPSALVICSPRLDPRRLAQALGGRGLRAAVWGPGRPTRASAGKADAGPVGDIDVLLVSSSLAFSREAPEGFQPSHVVYLDLPSGANRSARWTSHVIALVDPGQEKEISRLQEAIGVTLRKEDIPGNDEVVTGSIDRILRNLQNESDKEALVRLRSRIRRQVPFFQRPLFMAYLLKSLLPPLPARQAVQPARDAGARQDFSGREAQPSPGRGRSAEPAVTAAPPLAARSPRGRFGRSLDVPRPPKPASPSGSGAEFTQLFVSIGRNRRVFARELTELFTAKLQLDANDLGSVRVFDKYSFVDIRTARADEAITKLSGSELKGRTISVNYAKKKEEKGGN